jgi:hypothetical protein
MLKRFLYLLVYKPHFLTIIYPPKLGCGSCTEYYILLTTEPAMPVLYVVKLPVETASVWDCYLASFAHAWMCQLVAGESAYFDYMRVANTINSQKLEDHGITDKLPWMLPATTKVPRMQSKIFLLSHRWNLVWLIYELLFPNTWPKNLGAAYTRANTVFHTVLLFCFLTSHQLHRDECITSSFVSKSMHFNFFVIIRAE